MNLSKIESWFKLSEKLSALGYLYSGSKESSFENEGHTFNIKKAAWCKNCTYDIDKQVFHWKGNQKWSVFLVNKNSQGWNYEYYFPDRASYNNFSTILKRNGYKQDFDSINDDRIYARYTKKGHRIIIMSEFNNGHFSVLISQLVFQKDIY